MTAKRVALPTVTAAPQSAVTTDAQLARRNLLCGIHGAFAVTAAHLKRAPGVAAVHDNRVQARRMRTLLKVWRKQCQPLLHAQLQFDLRDYGRALARTREADVRRQLFATLIRNLHNDNKAEVQQFLANLDQARLVERRQLRITLHTTNWLQRLARISNHIDDANLWALAQPNGHFAAEQRQFAKQLRRLHQSLDKKNHSDKQLHALRIAVKNTRYLGEALAELGTPVADPQQQALRQLQSQLGDLHDNWQLQQWLQACDVSPLWKDRLIESSQTRLKLQEKHFEAVRKKLVRKAIFK